MRLSKIKLAGFKSFVDPTTIQLPSNLVGVVGPNGCGKSNVIDAIRWVMGETSAKHLRGDSMEDVIFNGSSSRKPVGSATIELYFDNSDGAIGGQFASYGEISIRRSVDRDGTSQYFLNGTRCRRKDITNLFLGTGLGPRSYAIIEQGMVSRLVEARPDDMRTYVEEAAGISKYKERRRETENRMHHTRENLARLNDLREEVEKQIRHLQRQAQVAEKYRSFKQQERQLEAELLAIRLAELDRSLGSSRVELAERQAELESVVADQRQLEADIERARAVHVEASDAFTRTQAAYYAVQSEISRLEQALAHGRELRDRQQQERGAAGEQLVQLEAELARDQERLRSLEEALAGFEPELAASREAEAVSARELHEAEEALDAWQERWTAYNLDLKEHQHARQVEQTRLEHLHSNHGRLSRQLEALVGERDTISGTDLEGRLRSQLAAHGSTDSQVRDAAQALEGAVQELARQRVAEQQTSAEIEQLRSDLAARRGRLDTLQAVQQAALGNDEEVLAGWLRQRGLAGQDRLVKDIKVRDPWARAVETVLGDFLQAVCVGHPEEHAADLPEASLVLLDAGLTAPGSAPTGTLAREVDAPGALQGLLESVLCARDLAEALALRKRLAPGQSVITPDGTWLGAGWVRVSRGQRYAGLIAREQEIRDLAREVESGDEGMARLTAARAAARERITALEQEREAAQGRLDEANRRHMAAEAAVAALRQEQERARERLEAIGNDVDGLRAEREQLAEAMADTSSRLSRADSALAELEARGPEFRAEQETLLGRYNEARTRADGDRARIAHLMIDLESRRAAREGAGQALERVQAQCAQLQARMADLGEQIAAAAAPLQSIQQELDGQLARQVTVQQALAASREQLESVEQSLRADEGRRHELEKRAGARRESAEALRIQTRELEVRRESLAERFAATGMVLEEVAAQLPGEAREGAAAEAWDQRLTQVRNSIERLGPINLAAIDEFAEQNERKTYLDAQYADLSSALETLEQAIRKIDRETRTRFQETFDNINSGLQRIFPRLFGGGHAYLSLEGDDLLSAGVTVMARPPGKRNSHIHLLSGGEKALTAVALIFSIFELNPAPFCLLDEVDAPLDEANVGRFCDIVREMSRTVQFVVITHNKTTMEMTRQLMGVTMNEPGVSRLVAVDIDEAVKLAAS